MPKEVRQALGLWSGRGWRCQVPLYEHRPVPAFSLTPEVVASGRKLAPTGARCLSHQLQANPARF